MKIQRVPAGFTELLGVRAQELPSELVSELRGTVEMVPFYLSRLGLSSASGVNAATSLPGHIATVTVPLGQVWWLVAAQGILQATTVGDQVTLSIGITADGFQCRAVQGDAAALNVAINATARLTVDMLAPTPIVLTAGNEVFCVVNDIFLAAGTRSMTVAALFYRLSSQS